MLPPFTFTTTVAFIVAFVVSFVVAVNGSSDGDVDVFLIVIYSSLAFLILVGFDVKLRNNACEFGDV
jgi:hypothetical protein